MANAGTTSGGATVYPSRHPVMAKLLENPSMISVRSCHSGIAQHRKIFAAVNDARIDFVGEHPQVVLDGEFGQGALHCVGINRSRRIARRIRQQHARARRDLRRNLGRIGLKMVARRECKRHGNRTQSKCDRGISGKAGIGIQNFIARFEQRHHREKERELASRSDHDVRRRNRDAARASEIGSDLVAQRRNADHRAVAVFAVGQRFRRGIDHRLSGMEIRLAQFEMNDGAALGFEFLGAGED